MKILICHSDLFIKNVIVSVFNGNGHQVTVAKDGLEAMNHVSSNMFDVCVLGFIVPLSSGIALCEFIRKRQNLATPIVMISAVCSDEVMLKANDAGVNAMFTNPVDPHSVYKKAVELSSNL